MATLPKISVVTPSLNCAHLVKRCIETVLAQDYPNFEHIIIDGGSTDGTVDILKSYPHVQWISEKDRGEADALNKGFARASGEIVTWLNTDDEYIGRAVYALVTSEAAKHPEFDIFYGRGIAIDEEGRVAWARMPVHPLTLKSIMHWVYDLNVCQPAMFFRRQAIMDAVLIPPDMKYGIDNYIWLKMAVAGHKYHFINRPMAYACLVRTGAKSSASVEDQITGIHKVTLEFEPYLSQEEKIIFYRDYWKHRFHHHGIYSNPPLPGDKLEDLVGYTLAALEFNNMNLVAQGINPLMEKHNASHEAFWLLSEILNKNGMHKESLEAIEHAARLLGANAPTKCAPPSA